MKKKTWFIDMICFAVILLAVFMIKSDAIFQCGNPLPYLISAIQISEEHPYIKVNDGEGIYIAKRGQCSELMDYVQEATGIKLVSSWCVFFLIQLVAIIWPHTGFYSYILANIFSMEVVYRLISLVFDWCRIISFTIAMCYTVRYIKSR